MIRMLWVIIIFVLLGPPLPAQQQEHKRIIEKVAVNWWQVPLFAIDQSGKAVTDLKAEEIRLTVNKKEVTNFAFIKHEWVLPKEPTTASKDSEEISFRVEPAPGIPHEKPMVFLLFDLALTGRQSVKRAKEVAKGIITKSEPGTRIVIMTIEPFAGLTFIARGTVPMFRGNKEEDNPMSGSTVQALLFAIDKKVIIKNNSRVVPAGADGTSLDLEDREGTFLRMQAARFYRRKCTIFFRAFQALFFHLNGIPESKVVFLFSEGISTSVLSALRGGRTDYNANMKRVTNYLNQCGAVLFLINTMGVEQYASDITSNQHAGMESDLVSARSGDSSLHYMARESGGKYLKGTRSRITSQLENIHRAFYEIAFPDRSNVRDNVREIAISTTRKGVSITTVRALEKGKPYKKMSKISKEVLVADLIMGNPLVEARVSFSKAEIKKTTYKNNLLTYYVTLPPAFMDKTLDLFKVSLWKEEGQKIIKNIKRNRVKSKTALLKVPFYLNEGEKRGDACFVLVEPVGGTLLIHRQWASNPGQLVGTRFIASEGYFRRL